MSSPNKKPHVLFLFSDTGGGHRTIAEAIIQSLREMAGEDIEIELIDFLKENAPLPLKRLPDWYPKMVKAPQLWKLGFYATDGRVQARVIVATIWPYLSRWARSIVKRHPSDLIVTVHPFATSMILKALGPRRPPFITMVTDYISNHALWYDKRADFILVPTEEARQGAIKFHMPPEKVQVVGMPVKAEYCDFSLDKSALRQRLGWPQDKFTVLLLGGGEGMGPIEKTAHAVATSGLDLNLVIVAGRNARLKSRLEAHNWPIPVMIHGFTTEMPKFMHASDVILTKPGAATVTEALNSHVPMIFYSRIPGQEDGNVDYVVSAGAGVWAPKPKEVVQSIRLWASNPLKLQSAVSACQMLAQPKSSDIVSRIILNRLGLETRK